MIISLAHICLFREVVYLNNRTTRIQLLVGPPSQYYGITPSRLDTGCSGAQYQREPEFKSKIFPEAKILILLHDTQCLRIQYELGGVQESSQNLHYWQN